MVPIFCLGLFFFSGPWANNFFFINVNVAESARKFLRVLSRIALCVVIIVVGIVVLLQVVLQTLRLLVALTDPSRHQAILEGGVVEKGFA